MNEYPLWRYLLVLAVVTIGVLYALPNLYGDDPALQISARRSETVDQALADKVDAALKAANVASRRTEVQQKRVLLRFDSLDTRAKAREVVEKTLGENFITALNMAPATPEWLKKIGAKPMYMGLDLRGGVHFLMQVDMDAVRTQTDERFVSELRSHFRDEKIRYRSIAREPTGGVKVEYQNVEMKQKGDAILAKDFADLQRQDLAEPSEVLLTVSPKLTNETRKTAIKQNLTTLRNRVNEFGVAEPVIQQQGEGRIVVQLPGVEDTAEAKKILGATATLEFRMVDTTNSPEQAAQTGRVPVNSKLLYDKQGRPVLVEKKIMLTGEYIIDASSGIEQSSGGPAVFITLDGKGSRLFSRATREQIGKPMAVVYIEQRKGRPVEEVINVATIRDELSKRFQISGLDSTDEAHTLALLLRAGALAAPIEIVEERTVGPSLGQDNIDKGFMSAVIGLAAVVVFTVLYYKAFGIIASIALSMNVVLLVALLSMLQATLTLPGIAGIVLTVGMAIDANVLINERIREELRSGNTPQASIHAGYDKAFATILDANVTHMIAALVLFLFGTGPVKGFAVTLTLGILTSAFTAITGTRAIVNLVYGRRRLKAVSV
ncbi:MAG: protein translocase subunit SecD [Gammaproteobacteria bacterium]|nr:protein translocase subunit SecD [Gammaproteobacteria bacterium]